MKTVLRRDKGFLREGGAAIVNQILCRARYITPVQIRDVLQLNECAGTVSRTLFYPSHKKKLQKYNSVI